MANYEIFIPCRTSSTRLPFKHFRTIGGQTLIERLISRLSEISDAHINIICPEGPKDDLYTELEALYPISVFRGDESNVLQRFYEAAKARSEKTKFAVRINGDCILPSKEIFSKLSSALDVSDNDIYTTVGTSVPSGLHVEAVRIEWLLSQADHIAKATHIEQEHVFPLLYDLCDRVEKIDLDRSSDIKLSVDTFRDLERVRYLIEHSGSHELDELARTSAKFDENCPFVGENGAYLIAEIGGNHEGDFEYAKELVKSACATDVDAIKLQIYSPDLLVNSKLDPVRWKHFKKFALPKHQYSELFAIIRDAGKHTSASVWSLEELEEHEQDIDLLKIGSGDLNNAPMLRYLARLDKPLVLSTGLATIQQAETAYQTVVEAGLSKEKLAVLQCTSMYPIPDVEANLSVLSDFSDRFECAVGYSDHTVGYDVLLDSVSAGAKVLEFHFSDDTSNASFRDHLVSLDESDTAEFVKQMRKRVMRLGGDSKHLTMMERAREHPISFRKGVFLRNDVKAGHVISEADLIALRPLEGIDATEFYELIGKTATIDIAALDALSWGDFSD